MPSSPRSFAAIIVVPWIVAACATTPQVATQTEEDAIRDLSRQWVAAVQSRNLDRIMSMYAPGARVLPPNEPAVQGIDAIRAMWSEMLGMPELSFSFTPTHIRVASSGDLAEDVGTYRVSGRTPEGPFTDEGKYVTVWTKVDGQWKVSSDMYNSDKPLPPPPAPVALVVVEAGDPGMHTSAQMQWAPFDVPGFNPGMQIATIHGNPSEKGDYTLRLKLPAGYEFPPHWHPTAEHVTVLTGALRLGMGEKVDRTALKTYTPGDFLYIPPKMAHFGGAQGETVIQLHGIGPFEIKVVDQTSE